MQRIAVVVLFLGLLFAPLLARRAVVHKTQPKSSGLRLVIITPHNQDIRREYARAFGNWYREHYGEEVTIDYRTPGGIADISRQLLSTYDAYRDRQRKLPAHLSAAIDVLWGGGDYEFDQKLKPEGIFQPMHLDPALLKSAFPEPTLSGVRLYDSPANPADPPAPRWVGVCLSSFGIIYNPEVMNALALAPPQSWGDLTNPRLEGYVALADPSHSGSAAVTYMMVLQRAMADAENQLFAVRPDLAVMPKARRAKLPEYQHAIELGWKRGMSQLVLIAANARYFADGAEMVPNDVARGDAAVGMAINFYARTTEQIVGSQRARFVLPFEATAITPDPVAILTGVEGEKLLLAQRFVEFLLTPQGQRLWALRVGAPDGPLQRSLMRMPIRRDVYADRAGWEDLADPFRSGGQFNQRGEWMGLMGDTTMIWVAAWIDARDSLKQAYDRIRRLPPEEAAPYLKQLADLPIEMGDVASLKAVRQRLNPDQVDESRAKTQIEWARKFREHYRAVMRRVP